MTDRRRVVVTGMGVKSPAGNTIDAFWETLLRADKTAAYDPDVIDVLERVVMGHKQLV